jgi:hypothetical protein
MYSKIIQTSDKGKFESLFEVQTSSTIIIPYTNKTTSKTQF